MPLGTVLAGVVSAFGEHEGLGEITDTTGRVWPFHCVEILDGSRSIALGANVEFDALAKLGRFEAARIRPVPERAA
jgi:CspA family cold shock protein